MGAHLHAHGSDDDDIVPRRTRALLTGALAVAALATLVGLVALWPSGRAPELNEAFEFDAELHDAVVETIDRGACAGTDPSDAITCVSVEARLTEGPDAGTTVIVEGPTTSGAVELKAGERIVVGESPNPPDSASLAPQYYFADYQRQTPMLWLAVLFVVAVVALGRWRGLRALVALAVTMLVLTVFVLPAVLEGHNPVAVALTGSAAIMFVALYLSHGFNLRTSTAMLGTLLSLLLTGALALVFVRASRITGLASEEALFLRASTSSLNLQGLLLGGIVIGSLGVLDDVTVTQASAVWELHKANPSLGWRRLYSSALRIGRDHIASTVNTLVLAYAGASLPLLILFTQAQRPLGDVATGEVVAVEILRTLVGSIGLVASVPVTTALAALVVATSGEAAAS
ncbi:MAG: YibE/F family protein [uncultured Acidimicrobiales bacterium]|uniref:YibE/F family protein n=1 Tax=uncultured Acidimicrobiales bacterium TaxID=310071 RepID=A0A6J4I5R5_9ACTN|nr:MAG: YibE/F family protein [uncultured Acidimicrobiales bacterium]